MSDKYFRRFRLPTIKKKIKTQRLKTILINYNISKLKFLKIDTEGHDCIILTDYFNTFEEHKCPIKKIQFEWKHCNNLPQYPKWSNPVINEQCKWCGIYHKDGKKKT